MKFRGDDVVADARNKQSFELKKLVLEIEKTRAEREDQEQLTWRMSVKWIGIAACAVVLSILTCEVHRQYSTDKLALEKHIVSERHGEARHKVSEEHAAEKMKAQAILTEKQAILKQAEVEMKKLEPPPPSKPPAKKDKKK